MIFPRWKQYLGAAAILICFAADDHRSFENAKSKWHHEARSSAPGVPIFLVKTKSDLMHVGSSGLRAVVSTEMGEKLTEELQAIAYIECSSFRSKKGIQKVFEAIARQVRALGVTETTTTEHPGTLTTVERER